MPMGQTATGWDARLKSEAWAYVERESLPAFLNQQRWYAGKARQFSSLRVVDSAQPEEFPESAILALVEVTYGEGAPDTYFLPLGWAVDTDLERLTRESPDRIIARFDDGPAEQRGAIYDGLADSATCWAMLDAIDQGRTFATTRGAIRAVATTAYPDARGAGDLPKNVKRGTAEQSNSAVFFDHRLLLKVFRRIEPGINPDYEIGRFLTEKTTFDRIPRTAGTIEHVNESGSPTTLAILQSLVRNQGTGWEHALRELATYYPRCEGVALPDGASALDGESYLRLSETDLPPAIGTAVGSYLVDAATLGKRTAELHRALAGDPTHREFAPDWLIRADLVELQADARSQFARTLEALRTNADRLDAAIAPQVRRVLDEAPGLLAEVDSLPKLKVEAPKIRCHGDYHLGQTLRVDGDFVLLDFEGEPARSLDDRRKKQTPLKDVVGMLRSFDYAAAAALFAFSDGDAATFERMLPWARLWQTWISATFLKEYRATAEGAGLLPADRNAQTVLLRAFTLEKALYELLYELNNRPNWVRIPLQGVLSLIG